MHRSCLLEAWKDSFGRLYATVVLVYTLSAAIVSPRLYLAQLLFITPGFLRVLGLLFALSLVTLCLVAFVKAPDRPIFWLARSIRPKSWAVVPVLAFPIGMAAYTTLKVSLPSFVPFYLDAALADAERTLLGADPWAMVHGSSLMPVLDLSMPVYGLAWFIYWCGTYLAFAISRPNQLRSRYLLTYWLVLAVVGTVLATSLSSVGPIFYDRYYGGERFDALLVAVADLRNGPPVLASADYLWSLFDQEGWGVGGGISAAPSVHCAAVVLNALAISKLNANLGYVAWAFAALIWLLSIATGWHYAIDGVISFVVVLVIWRLVGAIQPRHNGCQGGAATLSV